jgi:radical SAM family protein
MTIRRRVGVLDLLADAPPRGWDRVYASQFRRQFVSIPPQAVAVWCRQLGHRVSYATYYGQQPPADLLPDDLDVVFIGAYTKASALAYALAKLFRRRGALTVLGGPHAGAFPTDALRFFDIVVDKCDKTLVDDIVRRRFDPPVHVSSRRPLTDLPGVEERLPELCASSLAGLAGRGRSVYNTVPLLASVGCPYACDFCVDWKNEYVRLPSDRLVADLAFVARRFPRVVVTYHDPNFGVQFDKTLDAIESVPEAHRNPYVMESSLSILKPARLERLRRTRCAYVAAGIESWADYSNKSGSGSTSGWNKLEKITEHFRQLRGYIAGFQANFVFGTDADRGREPLELTKEFARRVPFAWPGVNIPTPFGGTPFFDRLWAEGRVLRTMPFAFYYDPYLTFVPAHYTPIEYYDLLIDLFSLVTSREMWAKRLTAGTHWLVKFIHSVQACGMRHELGHLKQIRALLATSPEVRAFHDGRSTTLPEFYHHRFERMLGPYAELLSRSDRVPLHHHERSVDDQNPKLTEMSTLRGFATAVGRSKNGDVITPLKPV